MRTDAIIQTQLLMAQTIGALADHIDQATGYQITPLKYAELPSPQLGMIACITNSNTKTWGGVISPVLTGTSHTVLAWYNGTDWTVIGS